MKMTKTTDLTIDLEALSESDRHLLCDALLCLRATVSRITESLPRDDDECMNIAKPFEAIGTRCDDLRAEMISVAERSTGAISEL